MAEFFKYKKIEDNKTNVEIKKVTRNSSVLGKPEPVQQIIDKRDYIFEINKVKI